MTVYKGTIKDENGNPLYPATSADKVSGLATVATSGSYNDLSNKPTIPDTSNFVDKTSAQTISGVKTFTNGISVSGRSAGGGDDEGIVVGTASNNYAGVCCGSPSGRRAVFYLKPSATSGNSVWRYNNGSTTYDIAHPEKAGTIALTSDLSGKQDALVSGTNIKTINNESILGSGNIAISGGSGTITEVQLNGTSVASSGVANVKALPNYNLSISTSAGNPREVRFVRVNYSTFDGNNAAYFKIGAMCSHGNGSSYTFLEDIIIGVSATPSVTCEVYKQVQNTSTYTVDSRTVYFGDVYWVVNTTDKYVDFFIIAGQYATLMFTPFTKIGNTVSDTSKIVQSTGSAVLYSSGTRNWANGDGTLFARKSDIPNTSSFMPKSGGTFTGDVDWSSTSAWIKPYLLAFKNADTNTSPTYPYTGFYQWGNEWQVNARDSSNVFAHNLLTINNSTKAAVFTGSLSAPNIYATSDRRLKENIKDAEIDCESIIEKLHLTEFNFKDDDKKNVVVGAIAQELKEILPEKYQSTLVQGSEDTTYSINEGKLLYITIGALKEEQKKVRLLEDRIIKLEKLLDR